MRSFPHSTAAESQPLPENADLPPGIASDAKPALLRLPPLFVLALIIGLVIGTILWMRPRSNAVIMSKSSSGSSVQFAHSEQVLRLKGSTEAVQSRSILAPVLSGQHLGMLTITRLAAGGSYVKRGDVLVEFDRQAQMRDFLDKQADYSKLADQVVEEQAKEISSRAKDETELKQAEDNFRKAELEIQKVEVLSEIDAEKAQENLEEAKATLEQLRETFDLRRQAAAAAIRILEIQRDRTRETMLHAQTNADLMQIHAPLDGVVVLNTIWKFGRMGEVQEGDQVRSGVAFMQVVDPSVMQVSVAADQEDFFYLKVAQAARVHLDAYPDVVFPGRLEQIAPLARGGDFSNKLRTFEVVFSIQGTDARLMPDLSAAVDVDVSDHNATPRTPR
jgi:HlyD family secretion protein